MITLTQLGYNIIKEDNNLLRYFIFKEYIIYNNIVIDILKWVLVYLFNWLSFKEEYKFLNIHNELLNIFNNSKDDIQKRLALYEYMPSLKCINFKLLCLKETGNKLKDINLVFMDIYDILGQELSNTIKDHSNRLNKDNFITVNNISEKNNILTINDKINIFYKNNWNIRFEYIYWHQPYHNLELVLFIYNIINSLIISYQLFNDTKFILIELILKFPLKFNDLTIQMFLNDCLNGHIIGQYIDSNKNILNNIELLDTLEEEIKMYKKSEISIKKIIK